VLKPFNIGHNANSILYESCPWNVFTAEHDRPSGGVPFRHLIPAGRFVQCGTPTSIALTQDFNHSMSTRQDVPRIPIHALFGTRFGPNPDLDARETMKQADMIFGIDVMTGDEFLFYGRDLLNEIAKSGVTRQVAVVAIELDLETEELEMLAALVQVIKGKHDYRSAE
jgi:hypothetical protein